MQLDGQLVPIELVPIILVTKRKGDKDSPSLWSVTRFRRFYQAFCRAREPRSSLGAKSFGDSLTTFLLFFVKKYKYTTIYLQVHIYKSTKVQIQLQAQKYNYTNTQIHREQQLKVFVAATLVCATVAATPGFCDSRSDGTKTADEVETLAKGCKSCCRYFCFFSPSPGYKIFNHGYIL